MNNMLTSGQTPWLQIVLVILLASGAALVNYPLSSYRPTPENSVLRHQSIQSVDARLWQDPFAAIRSAESRSARTACEASTKDDCPADADIAWLSSLRSQYGDQHALTLGVMVSGGAAVGDNEARRRARYAVLSALQVQGYSPEDAERIGQVRIAPGTAPSSCSSVPASIPFEWLSQDNAVTAKKILLLWLDERAISETRFNGQQLAPANASLCIASLLAAISPERNALIGPASSSMLLQMLSDLKQPLTPVSPDDGTAQLPISQLAVYSPYATVAHDPSDPALHARGFAFHRNVSTDDVLAAVIFKELHLRRIGKDYGLSPQAQAGHIALISQWDTLYARRLQQSFEGDSQFQTHHFRFMRGLDGKLHDSKEPTRSDAASSRNGTPDPASIERPDGDAQTDYLRRISAELAQKDRLLRAECSLGNRILKQCGIRAIGILANDYYDKLLILQALRKQFTEAIFFTTDLEAAMLHPADNQHTRNLLVASSFGLGLPGIGGLSLQDGIAPFRDSYQTATFHATQLAVCKSLAMRDARCESLSNLNPSAQLYEIGLNQVIPLQTAAATAATDRQWPYYLGLLIGITLWWAYLIRFPVAISQGQASHLDGGYKARWQTIKPALLLIGSLAIVLLAARLIQLTHEPLYWLEGVSSWPSELLRMLALIVSLSCMLHLHQRIRANQALLHTHYFAEDAGWGELDDPRQYRVWQAWQHFRQASFGRVFRRACVHTTLLMFIGICLLLALGLPNTPVRGNSAYYFSNALYLISAGMVILLIFCVASYIASCVELIKELSQETRWPLRQLEKFQLPQGQEYRFDDWLEIRMIAELTTPLSMLVFYPIAPLMLLLASHSQLFDAWDFSPAFILLFAVAFGLVLLHAWWLRNAAERARQRAIDGLELQLLQLHGMHTLDNRQSLITQGNLIMSRIAAYRSGAFAPFSQQASVRAVLYVIGAVSGLKLAEYMTALNI
ncbi:hypothetical protein ED236_01790 [Pseudomethylobacillus aquaticus]|uniref:Uncharacterized protein n=1 Tax=Pseudomethylobacillus aquaticus TaxID=2676064 RepID=A0A3N0V615_9PROT|nr:hypothetical protein [Pseudomethylobacillus aquaticus]ROH88226.1 hypothetical protein ED236_01790 [Pseudomethylobacillus aquaticus]